MTTREIDLQVYLKVYRAVQLVYGSILTENTRTWLIANTKSKLEALTAKTLLEEGNSDTLDENLTLNVLLSLADIGQRAGDQTFSNLTKQAFEHKFNLVSS